MVHRPTDSRLLVNLLAHERDYSKQLASLLEQSQASLTSFSAYASASAPPTSQIIVSIAGALYGADEALRKYAAAVDYWQQQLKALKEMEDGLGNIIRDREILVTRLIKASKNSKHVSRDAAVPNSSSSTLSYNGVQLPEIQLGTKLSAAQTELQACEAHLANKERELEAFRTATIRSGLQVRCKALIECGWTWGEMGKEGLKALDMFEVPNGYAHPASLPQLPTAKPLPDLSQDNPSSDHSSIAPSQSASQIGPANVTSPSSTQYTLTIGPAHSISEHAMPNGTPYHAPPPRIAEEPGGSSAEEGDPNQDVRVVENERFLPSRKRKQGPVRAHVRTVSEAIPNRHVHFPSSTSDTFLLRSPVEREFDKGKRGGSIRQAPRAVFGSIAALFRGHKHTPSADENSPTKDTGGGGRWKTRTDRNLKKSAKGADSSDDEDMKLRQNLGPLGPSLSMPAVYQMAEAGPGPSTSKMRKRLKRGSVQVPPRGAAKEHTDDRAWVSDTEQETLKGRKARASAINLNESDAEPQTPAIPAAPTQPTPSRPDYGALGRSNSLKKPQPKLRAPDGSLQLVASTPAEVSLSRNSSMSKHSTMSAPAVARYASTSTQNVTTPTNPSRRRTASLKESPKLSPSRPGPSVNPGSGKVLSGAGYPNRPGTGAGKTSKRATDPGMNLMSIVEDVRKNRDMFAKQQDPNRLLVLPKAPPPVSELMAWEDQREREAKQVEENLKSIAAASEGLYPPEPPTPTTATTTASIPTEEDHRPYTEPVLHSPPDKAHPVRPLRSALRNASRSPSPVHSPSTHPVAGPSKPRAPVTTPSPSKPKPNGSAIIPSPKVDDDDTASISSYETGLEMQEEDGETRTPSPAFPSPPPPPPAHEKPSPSPNGHAVNSDISHSTDSTTTEGGNGAPKRQKSVRMSLPPTFSTTPPAIYEEYDGDGNKKESLGQHEHWSHSAKRRSRTPPAHGAPAAPTASMEYIPNGGHQTKRGWQSHIAEVPAHKDVWEDSSDEDEEYGRAKKLLNRLSRKG